MDQLNRRFFLTGALSSLALISTQEVQAAQNTKITFVQANDVYEISPQDGRGGLGKLAAAVEAERSKGTKVIFTHGGDTLSPSLLSGFDQGEHMIELFNMLRLDAFVPGNHEFDFGEAIYRKRMAEAQFPIVAANLRDASGNCLPGHNDFIRFEVGDIKFAIVGATLEYTPQLSSPETLQIGPTVSTVIDQANALKKDGVDVIIALIHADKMMGQKLLNSHAVDIVLTGHNHDLHLDYDGESALIESEEDARRLICIDAEFAVKGEGSKRRIAWLPRFRIIDTAEVAADEKVDAVVKKMEGELSAELDVPLGTLVSPLDSHEALVRTQETAIGNLIADALRVQNHAEIGLTNGGGIRGDTFYDAGRKLIRRDILKELPFGNRSALIELSGKDLLAALENGFSFLGVAAAGRFPQISGMKVTVRPKAMPGSRVVLVEIGGEKLQADKNYRVATNDYMAKGGDGFSMLVRSGRQPDQGNALMANDVMAYCRGLAQIDAKIEGRIVFIE